MSEPVSVSREIAASPERVYALVCDLPRMSEWSPENRGGEWLDGDSAARPGARFRGRNRFGRKSWSTVSTILDASVGERLSFRVTYGPVQVAEWSYTFESAPGGSRVTESWRDLRPAWFRPIGTFGTGVSDRTTHNRRGMEETLDRLATVAEAG